MNFLGLDTNLYKSYYSLKSSDIALTWEALVQACRALSLVPSAPLHANFKLSSLGETLYLYDSNLVLQDELIFAAQVADSSLARIPNGSGAFVRRPHTIAANNNWALGVETTQARQPLLTLYPNPAQDILRVRLNLMEDASPWRIELVDATGRVHQKEQGVGGEIRLSVEGMTAGTYWLRLSHGDRLYLRSWIKR